jgi:hypothetical protein
MTNAARSTIGIIRSSSHYSGDFRFRWRSVGISAVPWSMPKLPILGATAQCCASREVPLSRHLNCDGPNMHATQSGTAIWSGLNDAAERPELGRSQSVRFPIGR